MAAELRYGRIPEVKKTRLGAAPNRNPRGRHAQGAVGPDDIADVVAARTGIPAGRLLEGETAVAAHGRRAGTPRRRAEEGRDRGI